MAQNDRPDALSTGSGSSGASASSSLHGKVCLVTGATRGIGYAIVRMLLAEGASVAFCGRRLKTVEEAAARLQAETLSKVKGKVADVSNYGDVQGLFGYVDREFGGLDILVNNAGIGRFAKVTDASPEMWASLLQTNLTGAFYCSREALLRFARPGSRHGEPDQPNGGHIVNISSLAGRHAFAGGAAYNASKFGLNGFSDALMLDARHDRVRVSTVAPGSVATEFGGSSSHTGNETSNEDWKVQPEDVAGIVRLLVTMPERTMVSYVEVRPSRPPRK